MSLPVEHLSISAMRSYCTSRSEFVQTYIRKEHIKPSLAMAMGSVFHYVVEQYYKSQVAGMDKKDFKWDDFIRQGIDTYFAEDQLILTDAEREKGEVVVSQALEFFQKEIQDLGDIVGVEETYFCEENVPIKLKGKLDFVGRDSDGLFICDWKLVAKHDDDITEVKPEYEMQAGAYFLLAMNHYGEVPKKCVFMQVKKTKNRDGGPQIKPYTVGFDPAVVQKFLIVYGAICDDLMGKPIIDSKGEIREIPNMFRMYGWEDDYARLSLAAAERLKNNPI